MNAERVDVNLNEMPQLGNYVSRAESTVLGDCLGCQIWLSNIGASGDTDSQIKIRGFDNFQAQTNKSRVESNFRQTIVGTQGPDAVRLLYDDIVVFQGGRLETDVRLLGGNDVFAHSLASLVVTGIYSETVRTGAGNDWIRVAQPHAASPVEILPGGELAIGLFAGGGRDLVETRMAYAMGGRLSVQLAGGRGKDQLAVDDALAASTPTLRSAPSPQPSVHYLLEGNADDDELKLRLQLAPALDAFFAATIDGGDGIDACSVIPLDLPNLRVINCEDGRTAGR